MDVNKIERVDDEWKIGNQLLSSNGARTPLASQYRNKLNELLDDALLLGYITQQLGRYISQMKGSSSFQIHEEVNK